MTRKVVSLFLVLALTNLFGLTTPAMAKARTSKQQRLAQKVESVIHEFGSGEQTRIEVKLRDRSKVSGYVSEIGVESFSVTNPGTGVTRSVSYSDVTHMTAADMSTGKKIAIGVGVAAAVVAVILIIVLATEKS